MRILTIHNYYQVRGGEDECHEIEVKLLREHGHHVDIYTENNEQVSAFNILSLAAKTVWSLKALNEVTQQLRLQLYDVVHVHNFFPLISPSVFYAASAEGIPVFQTLHNYRLLCPNALFFRNGKVCEDCLGKVVPYPGVLHGCYRGSKSLSAGVATMLTTHQMMQTWKKKVKGHIALTEFARKKFIEGGLPAEQIFVKPNFVHPDPGVGGGNGGYALFVGRLSIEKGLDTLLAAWEQLGYAIPLKIVGDGPLSEQVKAATKEISGLEWLGHQPLQKVYDLIGDATCLIMPSKWYETFGRVIIEAFAKGTPAIASNIGAVAELVEHGRTGLLFEPGNAADLAKKVQWLINNPNELYKMRQEARLEFEAKYTVEKNYRKLIDIYETAKISVDNKTIIY